MKPHHRRLAVVTATLDVVRARPCLESWRDRATYSWLPVVVSGRMGSVPAFAQGVETAFRHHGVDAVVCLHDDVLIEEDGWDEWVLRVLEFHGWQRCFAGFGGGIALGDADLYQTPYRPQQLARQGFMSNLRDAEAHGIRVTQPQPAVVFDGFCQIGTKDWFLGAWRWLEEHGLVHHGYDAALGCLARRAGIQAGMLIPVACHHYGGVTAVGSQDYHRWADEVTKSTAGDQAFWAAAHRIVYAQFREELPLRLSRSPR